MVYVLTSGSPSSALRSARWSVVNDQVAVLSRSRSGVRRTSVKIRSRSAAPYLTLGPPPCRGSMAASPSRLNRATSSPTASPERRPTRRAASVYEQPSATARRARARVTIPAGAVHGFTNTGATPLRVLAILASPIFEAHYTDPPRDSRRWMP